MGIHRLRRMPVSVNYCQCNVNLLLHSDTANLSFAPKLQGITFYFRKKRHRVVLIDDCIGVKLKVNALDDVLCILIFST